MIQVRYKPQNRNSDTLVLFSIAAPLVLLPLLVYVLFTSLNQTTALAATSNAVTHNSLNREGSTNEATQESEAVEIEKIYWTSKLLVQQWQGEVDLVTLGNELKEISLTLEKGTIDQEWSLEQIEQKNSRLSLEKLAIQILPMETVDLPGETYSPNKPAVYETSGDWARVYLQEGEDKQRVIAHVTVRLLANNSTNSINGEFVVKTNTISPEDETKNFVLSRNKYGEIVFLLRGTFKNATAAAS